MKKTFLFLAGAAIMFASCGGNENAANQAAENQKKIDSTANAVAAEKEAAMKAENDAKIAAAAKAMADSTELAKMKEEKAAGSKSSAPAHHSNAGTTRPTPAAPATPPPAPAPAPHPRPGAH